MTTKSRGPSRSGEWRDASDVDSHPLNRFSLGKLALLPLVVGGWLGLLRLAGEQGVWIGLLVAFCLAATERLWLQRESIWVRGVLVVGFVVLLSSVFAAAFRPVPPPTPQPQQWAPVAGSPASLQRWRQRLPGAGQSFPGPPPPLPAAPPLQSSRLPLESSDVD